MLVLVMEQNMNNTQQLLKTRLESLPKMHTSVVAGKIVTRWSELYEIDTWGKVENLGTIDETLARLTASK